MKKIALKVLKQIEDAGHEAYIVGGFVRDTLLSIRSNDIDIATSATPKELHNIFKEAVLPSTQYGSVTIFVQQIRFEITTFRKEFNYQKNRRPGEVIYIRSLQEDLLRRDFTMNTICMNQNGELIDLLNGKESLKKREIQTVGNSILRFQEDALRILRAIRFATILNFSLSDEIKEAIFQTKYLLVKLSMQRKKEELDKIFTSSHAKTGAQLILDFGLDEILQLKKLKSIKCFSQSIGIWAFLEVDNIYPFSKNEKELMKKIRAARKNCLSPYSLYQNGFYASSVAGEMLSLPKKQIAEAYDMLPIKKRDDLKVDGLDIIKTLRKRPGPYVSKCIELLEREVVLGHLPNEKEQLLSYCIQNQSMIG